MARDWKEVGDENHRGRMARLRKEEALWEHPFGG